MPAKESKNKYLMFFKDRIPYEEELLVDFFGEAYIKYALKTPICLPFVESFIK